MLSRKIVLYRMNMFSNFKLHFNAKRILGVGTLGDQRIPAKMMLHCHFKKHLYFT